MQRAIAEHLDLLSDTHDRTAETDLSVVEHTLILVEFKTIRSALCTSCGLTHHPDEGCKHHSIEASDRFLGIPSNHDH